jgi:hypothetical protein
MKHNRQVVRQRSGRMFYVAKRAVLGLLHRLRVRWDEIARRVNRNTLHAMCRAELHPSNRSRITQRISQRRRQRSERHHADGDCRQKLLMCAP